VNACRGRVPGRMPGPTGRAEWSGVQRSRGGEIRPSRARRACAGDGRPGRWLPGRRRTRWGVPRRRASGGNGGSRDGGMGVPPSWVPVRTALFAPDDGGRAAVHGSRCPPRTSVAGELAASCSGGRDRGAGGARTGTGPTQRRRRGRRRRRPWSWGGTGRAPARGPLVREPRLDGAPRPRTVRCWTVSRTRARSAASCPVGGPAPRDHRPPRRAARLAERRPPAVADWPYLSRRERA